MALEAQDNPFPYITLVDTADPVSPPAGSKYLWVDTDDALKMKDESGTVTTVGGGGVASGIAFTPNGSIAATNVQAAIQEVRDEAGGATTVATDAIWDTAGDLAVGTGANTAAKLDIGAAGGHVAVINGAVAWDSGTSFPGSKLTGDRYWRTDLGMEFYWNGTAWVSTQVLTVQMMPTQTGQTSSVGDLRSNISATQGTNVRIPSPSVLGASNLWLVDYQVSFIVNAGTALSGSHKWVGTVIGFDTTPTSTGTVATVNIDSGSSSVWRQLNVTIGAARGAGTIWYATTWTKTGTPGTLQTGEIMSYRIIAT